MKADQRTPLVTAEPGRTKPASVITLVSCALNTLYRVLGWGKETDWLTRKHYESLSRGKQIGRL